MHYTEHVGLYTTCIMMHAIVPTGYLDDVKQIKRLIYKGSHFVKRQLNRESTQNYKKCK